MKQEPAGNLQRTGKWTSLTAQRMAAGRVDRADANESRVWEGHGQYFGTSGSSLAS